MSLHELEHLVRFVQGVVPHVGGSRQRAVVVHHVLRASQPGRCVRAVCHENKPERKDLPVLVHPSHLAFENRGGVSEMHRNFGVLEEF